MGSLKLDALQEHLLEQVVEVHLRSFPGFFLTLLGPKFLRSLYEEIDRDPAGIVICCSQGDEVLGFVAGTTTPCRFYRRLLLHRWWRFAWAALWPAIRKPSIVPRLLNAFRRSGEAGEREAGCAELMSIAVGPSAQGKGVGRILTSAFLRECKRRGVKEVALTTDARDNEAANSFYERLGFTIRDTFHTAQGRQMNLYVIAIGAGDEQIVEDVKNAN